MPKKSARPHRLRGRVTASNISPKGHVEGVLVSTDDGTAQLNFPKHDEGMLAATFAVGASVDVAVELEADDGEHPVYVAVDGDDGEARGVIARLNYARHGEVNGFHLDDGTFVHMKPEGAERFRPCVGESVVAVGERRRGSAAMVLEARGVERAGKRRGGGRA